MKFKNGTVVEVVDNGQYYPFYKELVEELLPDEVYLFAMGDSPDMNEQVIIEAGRYAESIDMEFYIVSNISHTQIYIMSGKGLKVPVTMDDMEVVDRNSFSFVGTDYNEQLQELMDAIKNDKTPQNVMDHLDICCQINELYESKNADYGNTIEKGINDLGWCYLYSQLYNKLNRFINLTSSDKIPNNESLEDTLLDLANYAIEGVRVLRCNKEGVKP